MHSTLHSRARALAMSILTAGALASTGCNPSEFLTIQDPDIINPSNVSSAAGANAARVGAIARLNVATAGGESLLLLHTAEQFPDRREPFQASRASVG